MGTDKRERQKSARQLKIEAEQAAARRAQTKRTVVRVAVAALVVLGGVFLYSAVWGGDDNDDTATDAGDATTTTASVPEGPCPNTPTPDPAAYSNPELATAVLGRQAPDPAPPPAETAPDALEISTLIEGEGEGAAMCDNLVVHYIGKTADGTVFDESWTRGEPFGTEPVLTLGTGSVIQGWDEGLVGAEVGERRRMVIGSNKAYGPSGNQGIPPDAPLAFEVDIVEIVKPAADTETTTSTEGSPSTSSVTPSTTVP